MFGGRDADRSRRFLPKRGERVELRIDLLEGRAQGPKQSFTGFGRRHTARRSTEQSQAKPAFQASNGMAERGLRDAEFGCGAGKTQLIGDGHKGRQIGEMLAFHSCIHFIGSIAF